MRKRPHALIQLGVVRSNAVVDSSNDRARRRRLSHSSAPGTRGPRSKLRTAHRLRSATHVPVGRREKVLPNYRNRRPANWTPALQSAARRWRISTYRARARMQVAHFLRWAATVGATDRMMVALTGREAPGTGHNACRSCGATLTHVVTDLGMSPLCESYLRGDQLNAMEPFYPLVVYVCDQCFLVQLQEYVSREEIFRDYAYFSSYSDSWLDHCRRYVDQMVNQLGLTRHHFVVEVASNDGYLLQYLVHRGIPCLGIEPARNVADVALANGVPTLAEFFGTDLATRLAEEGKQADLLLGEQIGRAACR